LNTFYDIFCKRKIIINVFLLSISFTFLLKAQSAKIDIVSPNGNEKLQISTRQGISWISRNIKTVDIFFSIDKGNTWENISKNIDAKLGVYSWKIPNLPNKKALIKISAHSNKNIFDISKSEFTFSENYSLKGYLKKSNTKNLPTVIMPLGNSITYDNRVNDPRPIGDKAGYRVHLYELLTNAGINFSFTGSEHSGGNILPAGFDVNAGFPGITDDQLLYLLKTGWRKQPQHGINEQITVGPYLNTYPADIILLHIGTNGNDKPDGTSAVDVENILNHIDSISTETTVVLARIIDRAPPKNFVTQFNDNVETMALDRVNNPSNPAYPDKIVIVDMQNNAGIDYTIDSMGTIGDGVPGDMNDLYHPNDKGYYKMAELWFQALSSLIDSAPVITKQPENVSTISGMPVHFEVSVSGTKPFTFQWMKNGQIISGATDSILTINNVVQTDDSTYYSCIISNSVGNVSSDSAELFVASANERIEAGLQVLYNFEDTTITIEDLSKYGTPISLTVADTNNVKVVPYGIKVIYPTIFAANNFPGKLFDSCINSNEISVEAWIKPTNITQSGPARIITFSKDGNKRNFTLAQQNNKFVFRLTTTGTNENGLPDLTTNSNISTDLVHVVYTKNSDGLSKFYINGNEDNSFTLTGNFSAWDSTFSFGLGNEFNTDRNWRGTYYLTAIYNRALSSNEVLHNFSVKFHGFPKLLFPPTNLSAMVKNDTLVQIKWQDNSDSELGYIIERKAASPDSSYFILDSVNANQILYVDSLTKHSTTYFYRIQTYNDKYISDYSDTLKVDNILSDVKPEVLSHTLKLYQNFPNPFNPTTTIRYTIPNNKIKTLHTTLQQVQLKIYDILGREIATLINKKQTAGNYTVNFNAKNLTSGIYIYQLRIGNLIKTKKMVLLR